MKGTLLYISLSLLVCLTACFDLGSSSTESNPSTYLETLDIEGFALIRSWNNEVTLGTDDESASVNNRPSMKVRFEYDFLIGKHEVTCGEMGLDCADSLPATNVTYFDAVLYANKLSKSMGFDTAYTYTNATFDDNGACVGLKDLNFLTSVNAFRLPTEAEWSYAAKQSFEPQKSWNANNSNYKLQLVCSSYISADGLCDMAGNAKEWVEDALVKFTSTTVLNFFGVQGGSLLDERVVKGGSFRDDPSEMKVYKRGDIYMVTSSSKADYIGFRLAFGAIPNPGKISRDGNRSNSNISVLAESEDVNEMIDGYQSKLVIRDEETDALVYLHYSTTGSPVQVDLDLGVSAYHPDISPDGNWLAYCTGIEGVSGKSEVYAYQLDGGTIVKLNVESAAIPRWRVMGGDTVLVYVTSAGSNKSDSAFYASSTWSVPFKNGTFGTPKKLFDGAYHGGVSDDGEFAVTGAKLLRAHVGGEDKVWYAGEQACNVSLSGGAKHVLFLDFGGKTGAAFVGSSYKTHEYALIADSTGKLILSVKSPEGYTFDHTEWVSGSDSVFVATLVNSDEAHKKVVMVNAFTGKILDIAEGGELWHPAMWHERFEDVVVDPMLNVDSAGVYYTVGSPIYVLELRVQMENFWAEHDSVTAVALGSSRTLYGVHTPWITSQKMINMAFSSGDIYGMDYLVRNYVLPHTPKLKYLILETSLDFLWVQSLSSWDGIYDAVPGYRYDEAHDFWKDSIPDGFVSLVKRVPRPQEESTMAVLGEFLLPANGWSTPAVMHDTTLMRASDAQLAVNLEKFKSLVDLAKRNGVTVVFLIPPQNPGYAYTGAFGIYGVLRSDAQEIIDKLSSMGAVVFDENKMGLHDYTNAMAYNTDHLSREGAKQLTSRLESLLKTLEKQ